MGYRFYPKYSHHFLPLHIRIHSYFTVLTLHIRIHSYSTVLALHIRIHSNFTVLTVHIRKYWYFAVLTWNIRIIILHGTDSPHSVTFVPHGTSSKYSDTVVLHSTNSKIWGKQSISGPVSGADSIEILPHNPRWLKLILAGKINMGYYFYPKYSHHLLFTFILLSSKSIMCVKLMDERQTV